MKVIVYSKEQCGYCTAAIDLLRSQGKEYIEYKLDKDFNRETIKQIFPTAQTYPVITLDGKYIGGYDDLVQIIGEPMDD